MDEEAIIRVIIVIVLGVLSFVGILIGGCVILDPALHSWAQTRDMSNEIAACERLDSSGQRSKCILTIPKVQALQTADSHCPNGQNGIPSEITAECIASVAGAKITATSIAVAVCDKITGDDRGLAACVYLAEHAKTVTTTQAETILSKIR